MYKPDPDVEHDQLPIMETGQADVEETIEAELSHQVDEVTHERVTEIMNAMSPFGALRVLPIRIGDPLNYEEYR